MKLRAMAFAAFLLLAGCAGTWESTPVVQRMYVIECGENRVKDLSKKQYATCIVDEVSG